VDGGAKLERRFSCGEWSRREAIWRSCSYFDDMNMRGFFSAPLLDCCVGLLLISSLFWNQMNKKRKLSINMLFKKGRKEIWEG
jgi:hypothetical protein